MEQGVHILDQRGDLTQGKEGNACILEQTLNQGKLDAIVRPQ